MMKKSLKLLDKNPFQMKKIQLFILLLPILMIGTLSAQELALSGNTARPLQISKDTIRPPKTSKAEKIPKPPTVNRELANKRGFHIDIIGGAGVNTPHLNAINWDYGINRGISDDAIIGKGGLQWGAGVELSFYFSSRIGIGAGAHYHRASGSFEVQNFEARYRSDLYNVGGDDYWDYERIVYIEQLTENYTTTHLSIPVLLKFKTDFSYRFGMFLHGGAAYNLPLSTTIDLGAGSIDYEAIYYSDDGFNYGYGDGIINDHSLQLTEEYFFTLSQNADADETHLNNHFNLDVLNIGLNIRPQSIDDSIEIDSYISVIGRIGLMYNISDKTSIWIAGQYTHGLPTDSKSYKLADKIVGEGNGKYGEYSSLLNGGARYSILSGNLGVSIRF